MAGRKTNEVPLKRSLIHGVEDAVCEELGIASARHKAAIRSMQLTDDVDLARVVHGVITRNWLVAGASSNQNRSRENWRWMLQTQISSSNRSPEVILERAIAAACKSKNCSDWANQIPVSSGLVLGAGDRRRAMDLARRCGERAYEFIELKIASDTPLYAAIELLGYAILWMLAKDNFSGHRPELLEARRIDLRVLAPDSFYSPFDLTTLERSIDRSVRLLGTEMQVELSFRYDVLADALSKPELLDGAEILNFMAHRQPLHDNE